METNNKKQEYIDKISVGTIVAFKTEVRGVEKVKSAAVEKISRQKQKLKLKNKIGTEFIVDFADVLWVKTGNRWPKGIYTLLKETNSKKKKEEVCESEDK